MNKLSEEIKNMRENLTNLGMAKGIKHPDVIKLSQQLDVLIVKCQLNML